jgi:hypothetical protein
MTDDTMPVPDLPHEQMEDAAFYEVDGEYGIEYWPVDGRAVYGYLNTGERGDDDFAVPHRNALREPEMAVLALEEGDRLRVNDNNWMVVVDTSKGDPVARYENGEVLYELWWSYTPSRTNVRSGPRMFRQDGHESAGHIDCIEVDWQERPV